MTDIQGVMPSTPIPRALALIADDPNLAVDTAVAEAIPNMEPTAQAEALRLLGRRGHVPTLAALVSQLPSFPPDLQERLLRHAVDLHSGLRSAMESHELAPRLAAVDLIVRADDARSAYLLAGALRSTCHQTRETAATALHAMTERLMIESETSGPKGRSDTDAKKEVGVALRQRALVDALGNAIRGWEIHFQFKVLEAALWLAAELEPVIIEKLNEPRSRIGHALQEILETATNSRLAGFVLRALAIPWLRPAAAKGIGRARDGAFLRALARESWLLADSQVTSGCHWVHECAWARIDGLWPKGVHGGDAARLVRLFSRTGGASDRKTAVLASWLRSTEEPVRRAALEVLIADPSESATRTLTEMAARTTGGTSDWVRREIRRRRRAGGRGLRGGRQVNPSPDAAPRDRFGSAGAREPVPDAAASGDSFDAFVEDFDSMSPGERRLQADTFRNTEGTLDGRVLMRLRAKLASSESLDRALGLRVARELEAARNLAERIYLLTHDADAFVRSVAVAMLAELPGATSERILRQAVDDADPRVQANAIEALDRLDAADRVRWTEPKLESRHNRVRANAVSSLLRVELRRAGSVLLDMMGDPAAEHRLSALWVIEHLRLRSVLHHVLQMSREDADERIRKRASRLLREWTMHAGESFSVHAAAGGAEGRS